MLKKIWAPILVAARPARKARGRWPKFGAIFVAFGGYALIWGWKFALGVIVLIFLHEMGHFIEARREGLNPSWPVFIPFLGAYVRYTGGNAWQTARVGLAGPILGGVAALGFYVVGRAQGSQLLEALAYFGFFLNLLNLLPIGILDGGAIWRATRYLWTGAPGRRRSSPASSTGARRSSSRSARTRRTCRSTASDAGHADPRHPGRGSRRRGRADRGRVPRRGSPRSAGSTGRRRRSSARRASTSGIRATRGARDGAALRRARLGGGHRRRRRRHGGGEPRRAGGRRALGRLQHRAAARAGVERRTSTSRTRSSTSTRARSAS